ncbi:MAG: DUF5979 domain-containing protein, partial [Candidatus Cryosericum sp.]
MHHTQGSRRTFLTGVLVTALALLLSLTLLIPTARADTYDLTTDSGSLDQVTINGAIWAKLPSSDATGSGVFFSFLRVEANGTERGYNSDGRPLEFDEKTSASFTHSFLLADVPLIDIGGTLYREFQLDINESKSAPYMSLDEFQVWVTNDASLLGYSESVRAFGAGTASLVYDLGVGNWIKMDYRINDGSGKRDYRVYVPESNFIGKTGDHVVLFTRHGAQGGQWISDAGFEEWGVAKNYGSLTITKTVAYGGANSGLISQTFPVTVVGPSGTYTHNFVITNGVLSGSPWALTGLMPGSYTITEGAVTGWAEVVTSSPTVVVAGQVATATISNTFVLGALDITKAVTIPVGVVNPTAITDSFTVHVTGPSYPAPTGTDQVFTYNGTAVSPTVWHLTNLIPGTYVVTETVQGVTHTWTVGIAGTGAVTAGNTSAVTVTNTFVPGALDVTKAVVTAGVPNASSITDSFTVHVTGPSYPAPTGVDQIFTYNGTALSPTVWHLTNLIPGTYVVTETGTGVSYTWNVGTTGTGAVTAGNTSAVTVTNTFVPGSLEITKTVDFGGANSALISKTFTVTVTGPSYPAPGTTHDFVITNGVLTGSPWLLSNLIPGDYTIAEGAATGWTEVVTSSPTTVVTGVKATATVANTFVPG